MLVAPLFVTALRMARKARNLNSVEKATIDLGAGYLVSYERVHSFNSATDSDDPSGSCCPTNQADGSGCKHRGVDRCGEVGEPSKPLNHEPPSNGPKRRYGQYVRLVNTTSLTTPQGAQKASGRGFTLGSFRPSS